MGCIAVPCRHESHLSQRTFAVSVLLIFSRVPLNGEPTPTLMATKVSGETHPAEGQEKVHLAGPLHAVPKFPIHQMLPGKHQQAQAHGHQQHVEDPSHVVNVQLTAHHLEGEEEDMRREILHYYISPEETHRGNRDYLLLTKSNLSSDSSSKVNYKQLCNRKPCVSSC